MLRYRTGEAGSAAGSLAMARHLGTETLTPEKAELARYYGGEIEPLTLTEQLTRDIAAGTIGYQEAERALIGAALAVAPADSDEPALQRRVGQELADAMMREENRAHVAARGGSVAEVRPDMSPRMMALLGLDPSRTPREDEIANLLDGKRADGARIEGKQQQKPTRSVAEVFDLKGNAGLPGAEAVARMVAGRRASDGKAPHTLSKDNPKPLPEAVIESARRRFLAAYGIPAGREPTAQEVARMEAGVGANGQALDSGDFTRKTTATKPPIAYIDMIWSADKNLSIAWALAPTEAERAILLQVHRVAVAEAMAYAEQRLGFATKGKAGRGGVEPGEIGWILFHHYTSRPVAEIARTDRQGRGYTDLRDVPVLQAADPQIHTHAVVPNLVRTESGRLGAMDRDRLEGLVKELGAVYQAISARELRRHGVEVALHAATGAARLSAVPAIARQHFSKRTNGATEAARDFAKAQGLDWDALAPERQVALLRKGAEESREKKARTDGLSDFVLWRQQAEAVGYRHRSVLRPDAIPPALTRAQRRALAYEASLPLTEAAFSRRAKLSTQELREVAARGFVASDMQDPARDIAAVTKAYRERGIRQDGQPTAIVWGRDQPIRGKERWSVTTELHEAQERRLIGLARAASLDRTASLSPRAVDRAIAAFLDQHPGIDPNGEQWRAQQAVTHRLGEGGRLAVAIGVPGAGKSTILAPLVDAWKREGRNVYGATLAWRQSADLAAAGIEAGQRAAMEAFLRRVARGQYELDNKSVVVIDELGQLGKRQFLALMELQDKHGFQLVAVGDPKQCQSIEAGPVIDLVRKAVGEEAVPQILTTIRQKAEREREIVYQFRDGNAALALAMKRADAKAILVPGGRDAAIAKVARLWQERIAANARDRGFTLSISAPTNADARDIGAAIRAELQAQGKIEPDRFILSATDQVSREPYDLALAVGDRVRLFDRVFAGREALGNNGDVLDIRDLSKQGMVARNSAGAEGFVAWDKLRREGGPVRLSYGYALTIDAAQGIGTTEHISALVGGSRTADGFKAATAGSRHGNTNWLVVSDGAERREIAGRRPLGAPPLIRETDVWENIARNLSRQPEKPSALDFLATATSLQRGTVSRLQVGLAPSERRQVEGRKPTGLEHSYARRIEHRIRPAIEQVRRFGKAVGHQVQQVAAFTQERLVRQQRGPRLGR